MPTLKLEFLRHGPPQNQLLSPLTDYLALCADQPASSVRMPYEHAVLLDRLRAMAYAEDEGRRESRLLSLAQEISGILAQVPGLIAECSRHPSMSGSILQLRLVLSSNELALIPFELVLSPIGFPGAGEHLALQTVTPMCLTREVRRVPPGEIKWPSRARILFASAAPNGVPPVPTQAHLQALLKALDPWIPHAETEEKVESNIAEYFTLLPNATLKQIGEACRTGEYTHVHILAHGVPLTRGDDRRFGLGLHDHRSPSTMDVVDGLRLAAALRSHTVGRSRELARPCVVTLCSCDGGNVGTVVGAGASVAHELHAAGIPLVIASQFPLSIPGSVHMANTIYAALLKGDDPRVVLDDVRRQLRALVPGRHDWASVVAYAALPVDLERQLRRTKREQAERAIHAALTHIDAASQHLPTKHKQSNDATKSQAAISQAEARVRDPLATLNFLLESDPNDTEILGLLASAKKRLGEVYYRGSHSSDNESARGWRQNAETHLRQAYRCYVDVFDIDRTASWALVQSIILGLAIGREVDEADLRLASLLSLRDLKLDRSRRQWALRSLVELSLVKFLIHKQSSTQVPGDQQSWRRDALAYTRTLLTETPHEVEIASLRGQLDRYEGFFIDKVIDEAVEAPIRDVTTDADLLVAAGALTDLVHTIKKELDSYEGRPAASR